MTTLLPLSDAPPVRDTTTTSPDAVTSEDHATFATIVEEAIAQIEARSGDCRASDADEDVAGDDDAPEALEASDAGGTAKTFVAPSIVNPLVLPLAAGLAPVVTTGAPVEATNPAVAPPVALDATAPATGAASTGAPSTGAASTGIAAEPDAAPLSGADPSAGDPVMAGTASAPIAAAPTDAAAPAPSPATGAAAPSGDHAAVGGDLGTTAQATAIAEVSADQPSVEEDRPPEATVASTRANHGATVPATVVAAPHDQSPADRTTAATPAPGPVTPEPTAGDARPEPWAQVAHAVRSVRHERDGSHTMTVRLDPPELGSVDVEVRVHDGRLSVHATVDTSATRDLLTRALPELRSALESHGLTTASLDVGARSGSQGHADPHDSGARAGRPVTDRALTHAVEQPEARVAETSTARLDLRL